MAKGKYEKWLQEENLILLEGWARDGLTDEQIAHNMGISCSTLYAWKDKYSEISEALKKGKEVVDILVENALLKRALGYDVEEKKIKINPDGTKEAYMTTKHVSGDVIAQMFWLKNRKPDTWRHNSKDSLDVKEQEARIEQLETNTERIKQDNGSTSDEDDGVVLVFD